MTTSRFKYDLFPCDWCCLKDPCRFEYIDDAHGDLPMLFCSIDCLTRYVTQAEQASNPDNLLAKGGQDSSGFH